MATSENWQLACKCRAKWFRWELAQTTNPMVDTLLQEKTMCPQVPCPM